MYDLCIDTPPIMLRPVEGDQPSVKVEPEEETMRTTTNKKKAKKKKNTSNNNNNNTNSGGNNNNNNKKKPKKKFLPPHLRKNPQPAQPFEPPPSHEHHAALAASFDNVPRYLFRLHAPSSRGETTTRHVASAAAASPRRPRSAPARAARRDVFAAEQPPARAAGLVADHLRWRSGAPALRNLVSWSASLLVVLQHGLRRYRARRDGPDLDLGLGCLRVLVVDTRRLPRAAFVRDLDLVRAFAAHSDDLADLYRLRTGADAPSAASAADGPYYFGEYLSQGYLRVEGCAAEASLQRLVHAHLFQLCPGLADRRGWSRWANRVLELRRAYGTADTQLQPVDAGVADVRRAVVLASSCFGDEHALPLACMVLALQPRDAIARTAIVKVLRCMFTAEEIRQLDGIVVVAASWGMPETQQFHDIVRDLTVTRPPNPFPDTSDDEWEYVV
ncbi:phospholipid-translocating P-type ATPase, flippase [Purpureocillium lavendulum]|uniref:Phospholipid-translocating P-type ATPase, flippase n=1 Tax=Purpureocillium lavendulum TaxID=1247861 RepID=A0AB34FG49_9HYPO|nr:phospholipid-translocating P-type ATPase, flippase [Purpureocillium lavendulum]